MLLDNNKKKKKRKEKLLYNIKSRVGELQEAILSTLLEEEWIFSLQDFLNTKKKVVFLETKSKKDYTWNMESYGTEYGSPIIR